MPHIWVSLLPGSGALPCRNALHTIRPTAAALPPARSAVANQELLRLLRSANGVAPRLSGSCCTQLLYGCWRGKCRHREVATGCEVAVPSDSQAWIDTSNLGFRRESGNRHKPRTPAWLSAD